MCQSPTQTWQQPKMYIYQNCHFGKYSIHATGLPGYASNLSWLLSPNCQPEEALFDDPVIKLRAKKKYVKLEIRLFPMKRGWILFLSSAYIFWHRTHHTTGYHWGRNKQDQWNTINFRENDGTETNNYIRPVGQNWTVERKRMLVGQQWIRNGGPSDV